jgi:hypothetical protein
MALTFSKLREDVRGTEFIYRGQPIDLHGSLGERVMSKTRLDMLIHEAGREIQAEIRDQRQVKHNHMSKNNDTFAAPSDMLILSKIIVYDDDNENKASGTATGATSGTVLIDSSAEFTSTVAVGDRVDNTTDGSAALITAVDSDTQITCGELIGGSDNQFEADDAYEIYDPDAETTKVITDGFELEPAMGLDSLREQREVIRLNDEIISPNVPSEGMPQRYLLYEQDGVQFFLWDVKPDARYFFDVFYLKNLDDMTGDGDTLKLRQVFQSLYYLRSCYKVAQRLRDYQASNQFLQDYEITLRKLSGVTKSRSLPQTRFQLMP